MADSSDFEIVAAPSEDFEVVDPSQFEVVGPPSLAGNAGKALLKGAMDQQGLIGDVVTAPLWASQRMAKWAADKILGEDSGFQPLASPSEALSEARQKYVGNPEPQGDIERYADKALEYAPAGVIGGAPGVISSLASGVGEEAAKDLKVNPLIGTIVGALGGAGASHLAGKAAEATGEAFLRRAAGATEANYRSTANSLQRVELPEGDIGSLFRSALDDLIERGKLGKLGDATSMEEAVTSGKATLSNELDSKIAAVDKALPGRITPNFPNAQRYISDARVGAEDAQAYRNRIADLKDAIKKEGNGTLGYLQKQKKIWAKKWEKGNDPENGFTRAIYNDLKQVVENYVPEAEGINQEIQKYILMEPLVTKAITKADAANPTSWLSRMVSGGSGYAAPAVVGHEVGGPLGTAAGIGITAFGKFAESTTGRRMLGHVLDSVGSAAQGGEWLAPAVAANLVHGTGTEIDRERQGREPQTQSLPDLLEQKQSTQKSEKTSAVRGGTSPYSLDLGDLSPFTKSAEAETRPGRSNSTTKNPIRGGGLFGKSLSLFRGKTPVKNDAIKAALDGIRQVESSGGKHLVGPMTKYGQAKGAYQVLDSTGKEYHQKLGIEHPYDPYNEPQQREIAEAILKDYQRLFNGNLDQAITAYNTGPGNVKKGHIGPQGRAYLAKVETAARTLGHDI